MDFLADADEEDDFLTPKQETKTRKSKGLTSLFTRKDNTSSLGVTNTTEEGNDFKYRAPKKTLAASQGTEN